MPEEPYTGLFWGTIIEEGARSPFLTFLRSAQATPELGQLPYQTWWLDTGDLCVGVALPGVPALPTGIVAASQQVRAVPAHWIAGEHLPEARLMFLALRQLAARHSVSIAAGELLLVKACSPVGQGDEASGGAQAESGGTLLDCLGVIEEVGVSLLAVQVPEAWGLASPFWTPARLIEALTEPADGVCLEMPLEDFAEAPARFVLVQDAGRGVFAEIHCLCGAEVGALTILPVLDVLTHPEVRAWMLAQREARWQEMARSIVSWGLLSFERENRAQEGGHDSCQRPMET